MANKTGRISQVIGAVVDVHFGDHLPAILLTLNAGHRAESFETIHQLDRAVMLQPQPVRELADGGFFSSRNAADREQQLVLLSLESTGSSLLLTEC